MRIDVHGIPLCTLADYEPVTRAPGALRRLGLVRALEHDGHAVTDHGDVELEVPEADAEEAVGGHRVLNVKVTQANLARVRKALDGRVGRADVDLFVGGECSFAPAVLDRLAAVHGDAGAVVWLDAHGDLNTPATSPSGFVGGMALGLAAGLEGSGDLLKGAGLEPAVRPDRIVHVGARALDPPEREALKAEGMAAWTADDVRRADGPTEAGRAVVQEALARGDWLMVHLDVDAFDPEVLPCVDYPEPGGLWGEEVGAVLGAAAASGRLRAVSVTAYDPDLDRREAGREAGREVVARVAEGLRGGRSREAGKG